MEDISSGTSLLAARDRAVAAVVHAYGRGSLDDASCDELLREVQTARDVATLDAIASRLAVGVALPVQLDLAELDRGLSHGSGPLRGRPDPTGVAPRAAGGDRAGSPSSGSPRTADVARSVGGGRAGLRALDPVDLALAASATRSGHAQRPANARMVSLAIVVAMLVALLVLGMVLVTSIHGSSPGSGGSTGSPTAAQATAPLGT